MHFIIFTLSVFAFFSCPHVGRPTIGTKSFDSASDSILSDGPTGYMTNRSSCLYFAQLWYAIHSIGKSSEKLNLSISVHGS